MGIDSLTNFRKKGNQVRGFLVEPAVEVGFAQRYGENRLWLGWKSQEKHWEGGAAFDQPAPLPGSAGSR